MAKRNPFADDFFEPEEKEPTPVPELPWYETLRLILEPYSPSAEPAQTTDHFTTAEIISAIEQHHGVPQGPVGCSIEKFVFQDDFVRAMKYLGYREANYGGVQLLWMMKKKV